MLLEVGSVSIRNTKNILFKYVRRVHSGVLFLPWGTRSRTETREAVEPRMHCLTLNIGVIRHVSRTRDTSRRGVLLRALCVRVKLRGNGRDNYEWRGGGKNEL